MRDQVSRAVHTAARRALRRAKLAEDIVRTVEAAVHRGRPADRCLAECFRGHREYGSRDRRFYAEAVFAAFRWRGWCGSVTEHGARALLLAHWLDTADPDPAWRALAQQVMPALAEEPGWGALPLMERAAALARMTGQAQPPALEALVPEWTPGALARPDPEAPARWVAAFQVRPPLWLRAVGVDGSALCERLAAQGIAARAHPRIPGAVAVQGNPQLDRLAREIGPCFQVQDLAAQAVMVCAAPNPGESWWDACAGSGGKTWPLAKCLGPTGRVFATDRRREILEEMRRRGRTLASDAEIEAQVRDARQPPEGWLFDGVLLDAPCSGIGTWSRNPDARWRTPYNMPERYAGAQAELLRATARAVRPGGRLVYAVCTLTRAETDQVVDTFLGEQPDFEEFSVPAPLAGAAGARHWIQPDAGPCSGMFIALMRRRA